jgi:hypothetical protein
MKMSKIGLMAVTLMSLATASLAQEKKSYDFSPVWGKVAANPVCATGYQLSFGRAIDASGVNQVLPASGVCIEVDMSKPSIRGNDKEATLILPQRCLAVDEEGVISNPRELLYHLSKLYAVKIWPATTGRYGDATGGYNYYQEIKDGMSLKLLKVRSPFCESINQKIDEK